MADYHSPTIVRPDIPRGAMTLLEHRLLIGMFSHEGGEEQVYFFAEAASALRSSRAAAFAST